MSQPLMSNAVRVVDERLASMPRWARPPFIGMLFVYALMLARRGGIIIPILVLGVLIGGPDAALNMGWIIVAAGLSGFVGGIAFSLADALLRRLGRAGRVVTGWLTVCAYLTTAFFLLGAADLPRMENFDLGDTPERIVIGALSILFGTLLSVILEPGDARPTWVERKWVQRKQRVTSRVPPPSPPPPA